MLVLRLAVLGCLSSSAALADVSYVDFSSTAGLTLVGSAAGVGSELQVTPDQASQVGAVWATTRQDVTSPFTSEFTFRLSGGGEGFAFVIQRDAVDAIGSGGGGLGYSQLPNSIAIEFDTFGNLLTFDPSANHVSVNTNGVAPNRSAHSASLGATSAVTTLADGDVHTVRVEYTPGALQVYADDSIVTLQLDLDIASTLSLADGTAWVGFTAATSGLTQSTDLLSWSFDEQAGAPSGNGAPAAPSISEPASTNQPLNPYDVHMEAGPFIDPDGDVHSCSDYEIWRMMPPERVWRTSCIGGPPKVHSHLGDGTFLGSHAGATSLDPLTSFIFRVRFRDDSGDSVTDFSPWSEKTFQTGAASTFYPFETEDIVEDPDPTWTFAVGNVEPILPPSADPAVISLESGIGMSLLSITANDGVTNSWANPAALPEHEDLRIRIYGGAAGLNLGDTDLLVVDDECKRTRVLLPSVALAPSQTAYFWISSDGATWETTAGQTTPEFSTQARGLSLPWVSEQAGYQVEVVATDLELPIHIAFVPDPGTAPGDPLLYVTELYGAIKVVANDGTVGTYADNLLNFSPTGAFPGSGEQGVSGIAVDPVTGDVFAGMLYDAGGPHFPKVVRFSSADGGLTASTQTTILDMPGESQGQSHFISNFQLLPDRTLLVHMGDGFNASTGRNLSSYRGKILRMNLDGSPVTSNPFYNGGQINSRDYVYAYGVRNPFGGRYRSSDGFHYMVENGPSVDRFARVVPGRDYLWEGSDSNMFNYALHNWAPATGPVAMAWIEPETFGGSGFPQAKWDHAFVTESGPTFANGPQNFGKRITEFEIDAQGQKVSGPTTLIEYAGTGRATVSALTAGPDGLYFADLYRDSGSDPTARGANLLRVRWVGAQLGACGTIGESYCDPAVPNSTGLPAVLEMRGSDRVTDNDVRLDVEQLPQNALGYFLASQTQSFIPNPGGSMGNLCIFGTIGRFIAQAQNSGPSGTFSFPLDVSNMPPPLSAVAIGETWNFQAWYRDFQLVVTSNFTNAVSVDFQ